MVSFTRRDDDHGKACSDNGRADQCRAETDGSGGKHIHHEPKEGEVVSKNLKAEDKNQGIDDKATQSEQQDIEEPARTMPASDQEP